MIENDYYEGELDCVFVFPYSVDGGVVSISVADNGAGIAGELHERIWEPFFMTKDPDKGTGLGLSICRNIIEQCSGRLELESTLGVGTTLTILLPPHAESDRTPEDPVAIRA